MSLTRVSKRSSTRRQTSAHRGKVDDSLLQILEAWRFWLLGALVGAVLAWLLFQISPPPFRSQATVVVDNNLEEAWVFFPDRQLFQFLERESERLEQLAWSDGVMQAVSAQAGIPIRDLRSDILQLSHPGDGGWHFHASHMDAAVAQDLAAAWAPAFVQAARAAIELSPELQAARADLVAELLQTEPDEARLSALLEQISALSEQTRGISPFVELSLSQVAYLPIEPRVSAATYLLVGSLVGFLAAPLWLLLAPAGRQRPWLRTG